MLIVHQLVDFPIKLTGLYFDNVSGQSKPFTFYIQHKMADSKFKTLTVTGNMILLQYRISMSVQFYL